MFYSHAFQWSKCPNQQQLGYIKKQAKQWCEKHRNQPYRLTGAGYRPRNDSNRLSDDDKKELLRQEFQMLTDESWSNCCAWLSAVLLINVDNEKLATHMLNLMSKEPISDFEWMCFNKDPNNGKLLINRLQRKDIKYNLKKVAHYGKEKTYIDIMLDEDTKGQFLCQLRTSTGTSTHVIGVDCNRKLIFDCCEKYALKLTRDNLDYCCGEESGKLDRIIYCFQLVPAQNR